MTFGENTRELRRTAIKFEENGYYTRAPKGTQEYFDFWEREKDRCLNGYKVGDLEITGYHYFYLNFGRIKKVVNQGQSKVMAFPDFWDGDYNYFWSVEIARYGMSEEKYNNLHLGIDIPYLDGGRHLVVLKGRRKGYTYKAGAMMVRNFTLKRNSTTYAMASSKDYLIDDGLLDKGAWPTLAHINDTTPFRQPLLVDKKEKKKSGYKEKIAGNYVEKGTKNEIIGISLKDNPEKARGKGGELGFFEEAGKFPGLLKAWEVCKPSYEQGKYTTGLMIAYGTGGTEDGDYEALEQLFYDPNTYDVLPIKNIWDDGASATTGLFIPGSQNLDGFMDEYGNSDEEAAEEFLNKKRKAKKQGNDKRAAEQYIAEFPLNPREATLRVDTNIFPSDALEKQLGDVIASQRHHALSVGILTRDSNGKVKFQPDNDKQPLFKFPTPRDIDTTGAIVVKESPQSDDQGRVPKNLYFICHDPYAYDGQPDGGSLGASYVIKRANNFSHTYMGCPVASYVGRPPTQDEYNENLFKLAEYYNAKIAFENDRGNVIPYAKSNRLLSYLIEKPEIMENKSSNRRTTNRPYGISMNNSQLKNQGEIYIRDWLNEKVSKDVQGNVQRVYNKILDPALLEELMKYNSDGNFDRVSALMIGMFFMKELEHQRASVKHKENTDDFFNRQLFT